MRDPQGHENSPARFVYDEAFSRNIGWISDAEQQILRGKRVALAGMGGVGGIHAVSFARAGFSDFHLSDFDRFELANFNRQHGALMRTLGLPKVEVIASMVRDINPEAKIEIFPEGVYDSHAAGHASNIDAFLDGVDLYVDGFDFFVLDVRKMVFDRCREKGIPVICAAPIGMSAGYLVFMPDGISFDDYFGFDGFDRDRKYVNFLLGLTPAMLQRSYLRDPSRVDFNEMRGPSMGLSCQLCASIAVAEAIKILLRRGKIYPAPYYRQFDPYRSKLVIGHIPFGAKNPWHRLKQRLAARMMARYGRASRPHEAAPPETATPMMRILEAARWTPSGDNTQPWRFDILSGDSLRIVSECAAEKNVYQYADSLPTKLALGMLIENMALEASRFGLRVETDIAETPERIVIGARLIADAGIRFDPLANWIAVRSTDRRAYSRMPLREDEKKRLEEAVSPALSLVWHETAGERWRISALNAEGTAIRLSIPEAWHVHVQIIDRERAFSRTGIPDRALGLDPLTRRAMGWGLGDFRRMNRLLRNFGGMTLAKLEMDYLPGLRCAAHVGFYPKDGIDASSSSGLIQAGRAIQRFWLEAARLGLAVQPELALLCFAHYGRIGEPFTADTAMRERARVLAERGKGQFSPRDLPLFLARIGRPPFRVSPSRSLRRPLAGLFPALGTAGKE